MTPMQISGRTLTLTSDTPESSASRSCLPIVLWLYDSVAVDRICVWLRW